MPEIVIAIACVAVLFVVRALKRATPIEDIVNDEVDDQRRENTLLDSLRRLSTQPTLYQRTELGCMHRRGELPSWVTSDMCVRPEELSVALASRIASRPIITTS